MSFPSHLARTAGAALAAFLCALLAVGCGAGSAGPRGAESNDHELEVTIDGRSIRASGRPSGPDIDYGRREIRVVVGGSLAWGDGAGAEQMTVALVVNDVVEGEYALARRESEVVPGDESVAWLRLTIDGGVPVAELEPLRGVLAVSSVRGVTSAGRYRLLGAAGSFRGAFVDGSGLEHEVDGRFRYTR